MRSIGSAVCQSAIRVVLRHREGSSFLPGTEYEYREAYPPATGIANVLTDSSLRDKFA